MPTGAEADALIDRLSTSSHKQAVAVSKELREGVRLSVEDLANEIVERRLERKLAVYGVEDIERRLTRESLRFLYRILFLLYAEARPELRVVPTEAEGYQDGYGLDRLRELALVELASERARTGSHLHDSLELLFTLVDEGYHHEHRAEQLLHDATEDDTGLVFEALQSELFGPRATELIDSIRLRNEVLQRVLRRLLLTQEKPGRARQFVSYSTLGINQLGAVYEGLMAYTGFLAKEDLFECASPAPEEDGTWMVPVARAAEYPPEAFVERVDEDSGMGRRVRHSKGSFVFRLSGRDRQRTASYYTPEVLTRCVVRHALAELLDAGGERTPADRLLELTDLRAGARLRGVPQRGDQPARRGIPAPEGGRARSPGRARRLSRGAAEASRRRSRYTSATASTSTPRRSSWPRSRCGSGPCTRGWRRRGSACTCGAATPSRAHVARRTRPRSSATGRGRRRR